MVFSCILHAWSLARLPLYLGRAKHRAGVQQALVGRREKNEGGEEGFSEDHQRERDQQSFAYETDDFSTVESGNQLPASGTNATDIPGVPHAFPWPESVRPHP